MIFTGKIRWYVTCDEHGLRSTPILQQQFYYPPDFYDEEPIELQWINVDTVEEKVKRS